jgi:hypothetical protein
MGFGDGMASEGGIWPGHVANLLVRWVAKLKQKPRRVKGYLVMPFVVIFFRFSQVDLAPLGVFSRLSELDYEHDL